MQRRVSSIGAVLLISFIAPGCANNTNEPASNAPLLSIESSPLDEFWQFATGFQGTPEEQLRQSEEFERRRDELSGQCMHEAGFLALPYVRDDEGNIFPDPRQTEYMNILSDSELAAWWEAWWGPGYEQDAEGNYLWSFERSGCSGQAQYLMERQFNLAQSDEFRPLFEAMREFEDNLFNDPEVIAINLEWSNCMADAGQVGLVRPETIPTVESAASVFELADLDCQNTVDYVARLTQIVYAAETQFITDHRAELEALRAAAEQRP